MPTLLIWHGHKFRFYASDGPEPPHVHIVKDSQAAKIWLGTLDVAYRHGYNDRDMKQLLAVVSENRNDWIRAWNDFFGL